MAESSTPPPNGSDVPAGSDKFDVPPANYRMIGQMLAAGAADQKAAQAAGQKTGLDDFIVHPLDTLLKWIAEIVAMVLSWFLCIVAFIMRLITAVDDGAAPGMAAIVKNSLGHVFGLKGGDPRKIGAGMDSTDAMGRDIGKLIMDALKAGVKNQAGKPIAPGDTGATEFLAMLARLGVEGWIDGFVAEAIAGTHGAAILELVPIMNNLLGLGRLSRRALTPLVKILVQDPFTAKLHLDYRPAHLTAEQYILEFQRGKLTSDKLDTALGKQGYSSDLITTLLEQHKKGFTEAQIMHQYATGHAGPVNTKARLRDEGYDDETALNLMNAALGEVIDRIDEKHLDVYIQAFLRGEITDSALADWLAQKDRGEGINQLIYGMVWDQRNMLPKHFTLGQVETLIKAHVMNLDDLRTWMTRENYPLDEQVLLEIWLLEEIGSADDAKAAKARKVTEAAAAKTIRDAKAKAAADDAAARLATKGLTTATFEALVEAGLRSFDEFTAFLIQEGLPQASVTALVDLLHAKIAAKEAAAAAHDAVLHGAGEKHLPLSQIEAAVIAGTIPIDHLQVFMTQQKFAAEDTTTALGYVQGKIDAATAKAQTAADAAAAAKAKGVSLPNLERAARLGLTTPADYAAALTAAGFDPHAVELMTGILESQIAADKNTLARRAAAAAAAATKNISLPDLERAVINGLQPMSAYQAQLVNLGYEPGDVATLVALLQLQLDTARDVAAKKADAAARAATKNLSLSEIERAVKLHVLSIEQYRVELADLGFSIEDIGVLSASLLADLAAASAAKTKQAAAAAALANKGVSLAQEQQLVKAGLSSLDSYSAFLRTQGYSAAAAAQLTQLLSDQIAQAATAAAQHEIAAARAAERNISLAAEETAVLKGIRTLDDYYALLVDLGFNPVDQATLVSLLELRMQTAAAPAA